MRVPASVLLLLLCGALPAQEPPIIDMHLHALRVQDFVPLGGLLPIPHCVPMTDYPVPHSGGRWAEIVRARDLPCRALWSPASDQEVMERTVAVMNRRNVYAVTSGPLVERYAQAAPGRGHPEPLASRTRGAAARLGARILADTPLRGSRGSDGARRGGSRRPSLEPYWRSPRSRTCRWASTSARAPPAPLTSGSPLPGAAAQPARARGRLVRHPELRVYIMHAGWPMLDDLLAVIWAHPQVHVDVGVISGALPRAEFHRYLQRIVEAGFGKRVMFGSDQMNWPAMIERALEGIEGARFLSPAQKRDILFNNAARFLRLTPQRVAAMHGKAGN